ncbi:MAG: heavy metal translocating P-type ATPase [Desulfovibrio sp.]|nr:heavy metal translocating P-type ATPase [Desulfovibrio sp.]
MSSSMPFGQQDRLRVVHEIPGRVRWQGPMFLDPDLDTEYLQARLQAVPGVQRCRINRKAQCVVLEHDGDEAKATALELLERLPAEAFRSGFVPPVTPSFYPVAVRGAALALNLVLPRSMRAVVSWVLGAPVIAEGIHTLFTEGVRVKVLDGAVVTASLLRGDYLTSSLVVTVLSLVEYLEGRLENSTTDLLATLMRPQAEYAWVLRDGAEVQLPVGDIEKGDRVVCGPGELIPVDGEVVEGEASVNTSSISGEAAPAHYRPGTMALSGAVVEEGKLVIAAEEVGEGTRLARINRFLQQSLRAKSATQENRAKLADRLVPITFGIGVLMWLITRDIRRAASVLTVDFSCAIKLASPVAVRSSMYAAGHAGVIFKGAQALEDVASVDTLVFDKTGTLTSGELAVTSIAASAQSGLDENGLLALAAAAEAHYGHPVARAVVAEANRRGVEIPATPQVEFVVAHGVSALVEGRRVLVGSRHFIVEDEHVDASLLEHKAESLRAQGNTVLYVALDGQLAGVVGLADAIRPEARETLRQLRKMGIDRMVVLTGDHLQTANNLLRELPELDAAHAELKPEEKAAMVQELVDAGRTIAYVGDGLNDTPAMMLAKVGVCMPKGADLARETAQVLLLHEDIHSLAAARAIALRLEQSVQQAFWGAVGVNGAILALAAAGRGAPALWATLHNGFTLGMLGWAAARNMRAPSLPAGSKSGHSGHSGKPGASLGSEAPPATTREGR